jgi:hypothetical protein
MSANSSSGEDDGISIEQIVNMVIDRILTRLVGGILLAGGAIGSAFTDVGDALRAGTIDPIRWIASNSIGAVGDSLIDLAISIDATLLQLSEGAGIASPLVVILAYGITGVTLAVAITLIIRLGRRIIPIL